MGIMLILKEWWYLFSHEYFVDIEGVVVSVFHINILLILKGWWYLFFT